MPKTVVTRQRVKMADMETSEPDYNSRFDGLECKLNQLLQVNTDTNVLLNSALKRIEALEHILEATKAEVHEYTILVKTQESKVDALGKKLQDALEQIDQLENRHRQNNLRLLNVPEGYEKDLPLTSFLVKTLAERWNLKLTEEDFERAHRIGPVSDNARYPRAIIFKLHHFQKKLYIQRGAREPAEGGKLRIVPDMSSMVRARRRAFWPLREQLHQMNIKTFLRYPATLHIDEGGRATAFTSLEEAKLELTKKYPTIK
ncbi:unnamed protein product [Knipowitschia caucasica]|uniref:Transposase n=1 Tax=Knipowitschia caucasica TaxID=637954 RepID=A0AAV2KU38_KNICA